MCEAIRYELAENTCGKKTATHTAPVLVTECVAVVAKAHPEFTEETLRDFVEESFRDGEKRFEIEGGTIRALLPSRPAVDELCDLPLPLTPQTNATKKEAT